MGGSGDGAWIDNACARQRECLVDDCRDKARGRRRECRRECRCECLDTAWRDNARDRVSSSSSSDDVSSSSPALLCARPDKIVLEAETVLPSAAGEMSGNGGGCDPWEEPRRYLFASSRAYGEIERETGETGETGDNVEDLGELWPWWLDREARRILAMAADRLRLSMSLTLSAALVAWLGLLCPALRGRVATNGSDRSSFAVGRLDGSRSKHRSRNLVSGCDKPSGNGGGPSVHLTQLMRATGVRRLRVCQGGCPVAISRTAPPKDQISCDNETTQTRTHARTNARTHARTHARAQTHAGTKREERDR